MKMFQKAVIALSLILLYVSESNAASLYVTDPRHSFLKYNATIEEMTISVMPQGSYMEAGIYLTFSPRGSVYSRVEDTLEVVFNFELPENAFINDMWLYMEDGSIVRANLLDKWTAGFIYESIVQRRRDPSILTKEGPGKYRIKVFPLIGNSTRKVKINCYLPCEWSEKDIHTKLPLYFRDASINKPDIVKIYAYPDLNFFYPEFPDNDNIKFQSTYIDHFGQVEMAELNFSNGLTASEVSFLHDIHDSIFANIYSGAKENFYQIIFNLNKMLDFKYPKKIAFLFDYDIENTFITREEAIQAVKANILKNLNPLDSFALFFSNMEIVQYGNKWFPADPATVDEVFAGVNDDTLSLFSNLPRLLFEGCDWVTKTSDSAEVLLVACSDKHGEQNTANDIGEEVMKKIKPGIRISVCNYVQKSWKTNYIANVAYTGNDYLYATLTRLTRGSFKKIQGSGYDINALITNMMSSLFGGYEDIKTHISFENGFSYDEEFKDGEPEMLPNTGLIIQYGKFMGNFPMALEITGYYRKIPFQKRVEINDNLNKISYNNSAIWAGISISGLERSATNQNMKIYDIINQSLEYRVLSVYTAFLALEDTIHNSDDETNPNPVEEKITESELEINVYPNPLVNYSNINIKLPANVSPDDLSVAVFDVSGQKVKILTGEISVTGGEAKITWQGIDDLGRPLPNGVYMLVIKTKFRSYMVKIIIMR